MNSTTTPSSAESPHGNVPPIVIHMPQPPPRRRWWSGIVGLILVLSILFNFALLSMVSSQFVDTSGPNEHFHSGDATAVDKIAILEISGTIMPPFTERVLKALEKAEKDEHVKGIAVIIDSPGGLVADSHQIYHKMTQVRQTKPMVVAMKRLAASGGLYVAMGAGPEAKIYAEPTTWTGSIGVIIPRYDVSELAQRWGVASDPLTTGEFKDSLSPFRKMTEREEVVWKEIIDDAFVRFIKVIDDNRSSLDEAGVRKLATGRIFTAESAKKEGLIDVIGYEDEAIQSLQDQLGLTSVRRVKYVSPTTLIDILAGSVKAEPDPWQTLIEATIPRALYLCSWGHAVRND
ncbi:MAG: signal peptide peptidase SppA [Planctomycetaceae bacterium]